MNYYHCSTKIWNVGDIITAQPWRGYDGGSGIYVSTRPEPHFTLSMNGSNSVQKGMRLYKVKPLGKVKKGKWGDLVCKVGVEVVESLGEVAKSGRMSVVDEDGTSRVVEYDRDANMIAGLKSKKPQWLVVKEIYNPWLGEQNKKEIIRGFRRKDAAEKWAANKKNHKVIKREDL